MEMIRRNLFENPVYIYVFLGVCFLAILAIWYERRDIRFLKLLAVPAGLAGIVWLVSTLIVTDREEIYAALKAMAEDAVAGKTDAFEKYLADDFTGYYETARIDKKSAVSLVKVQNEVFKLSDVALTNFEATISGDTADSDITTRIAYDGRSGKKSSMIFITWQFRWTKRQNGWLLTESLKDPELTVPTAK